MIAGDVHIDVRNRMVDERRIGRHPGAGAGCDRSTCVLERHKRVTSPRQSGILGKEVLPSKFKVIQFGRRDLCRDRHHVVVSYANQTLIGSVVDVAGIQPNQASIPVTADAPGLMDVPDIGGTDGGDFQHVGASVETRDMELAGVVARGYRFAASLVKRCPGDGTAAVRSARTVAIAEIVGRAQIQAVLEHLLPDEALVVTGVTLTARAIAAAGIEYQLLEVVDVAESPLIRGEPGIAVGIAPDIGDVAGQRVLPSDRELAEQRALESDPGVAIEENAGRVHVSAGQLEFALHAGNQIDAVFGEKPLLDENAPSIATEPGRIQSDRRAPLGIDIRRIAERWLDDAVQQNVGARSLDD